MPPERDRLPLFGFRLLVCVVFLVFSALFIGYWLDDAFITFRYARNLAEGLGPVFNPGETVEGYTSFSWMIAAALPLAALPDPYSLRAIGLLGVGLGCFCVWRVTDFPGLDGAPRRRRLAAVLAIAPVFVINAADGMETPLMMVLLLESARAFRRAPSVRSGAVLGALTAAAILTRPESLPLLLVWPGWALLLRRGESTGWLGGFAAASLPPVLAHFAWRVSFYGQVFPNTFYAKASGALGLRVQAGLFDLSSLMWDGSGAGPPLWLWLGLGLALFGLRALRGSSPQTRIWLAALWTPVVFRTAFELWSGGDTMETFRFLAPALPALFVLGDEAADRLRTIQRPLFVALCIVGLASAGASTWTLRGQHEGYRQGLTRAHVALGEWLAESQPLGTWIAIGDAGAVSFYSRLPVIDLWGLNDATIARLPGEYGHRRGVADYVLGRRPGVIVLWNRTPIREPQMLRVRGAQTFDREIAAHPAFARHYRFVREFVFQAATEGKKNGYYLDVFERRPPRGSPATQGAESSVPHTRWTPPLGAPPVGIGRGIGTRSPSSIFKRRGWSSRSGCSLQPCRFEPRGCSPWSVLTS